jgi:hypothetical protein
MTEYGVLYIHSKTMFDTRSIHLKQLSVCEWVEDCMSHAGRAGIFWTFSAGYRVLRCSLSISKDEDEGFGK